MKDKWICGNVGKNIVEAHNSLFNYIEISYNYKHCHKSNDYISPEAYESKYYKDREKIEAA